MTKRTRNRALIAVLLAVLIGSLAANLWLWQRSDRSIKHYANY